MHPMFIETSTDDSTAYPSELILFSSEAAISKASRGSSGVSAKDKDDCEANYSAAPLMPLREQDIKAMEALFKRQDADEIEADVNKILLRLWPAPCWEDDPFDFLRDYL